MIYDLCLMKQFLKYVRSSKNKILNMQKSKHGIALQLTRLWIICTTLKKNDVHSTQVYEYLYI